MAIHVCLAGVPLVFTSANERPAGSWPATTAHDTGPTAGGPSAIVVPSVENEVKSEPTNPGPNAPSAVMSTPGSGLIVIVVVSVTAPAEAVIVTVVGAATAATW